MRHYNKSPALLLLIVCLLYAPVSIASAWTQNNGAGQGILTLNSYQSSHLFDSTGRKVLSGSNFSKYEINPFAEYGLTDSVTVGMNPTLQYWQVSGLSNNTSTINFNGCGSAYTGGRNNVSGEIIESEFFIRKKLLEIGNMVFSVQPLVKTPCVLVVDSGPAITWNSYETELRALLGYGFKWKPEILGGKIIPFTDQDHFVDLEVAYRKYNGTLSDRVKIDGTAGLRLNGNILLLAQIFSSICTGEDNISSDITTNNTKETIDRSASLKLQLSGVVLANKTTSIQLGVYKELAGINYGAGQGIIVSIWKGF